MAMIVKAPEMTEFDVVINRFELYLESLGIIKRDAEGNKYIDSEAEAVYR